MRLTSFLPGLLLTALAGAAPAIAAPNLVLNGGFEASSYTASTEFGASYVGQGVANWTSASISAFNLYWLPGNATTVSAANRFNDGGNKIATSFTGASPDGGNFLGLDGDADYNGALTQTVTGLSVGSLYNLSFYWAATQLQNRTGDTTEQLQVSLGDETKSTPVVSIGSQGFSGWLSQTLSFTATGTSEVLSFLSLGTPSGLPPIALLDGVSLTAVPEPASIVLVGASLFCIGLVGRRKA